VSFFVINFYYLLGVVASMKQTGVKYNGRFYTYDNIDVISKTLDKLKEDGLGLDEIIKRAYDNVHRSKSDSDRAYYKELIGFILDEEDFVIFASGVQTFFPTYDRVNFNEIVNQKYLYDTSSIKDGAVGFTSLLGFIIVITFIFSFAFSGRLTTVLVIMSIEFVVLTPAIIWSLYLSEKKNLTETIYRTYRAGFDTPKKDVEFYLEAAKIVESRYDKESK
jgi:hypothetical protein